MSASSKTFVVLVGVDRYRKLPVTAQLKGPVNDVHAWAKFAKNALSVHEEHILRLESTRTVDRLADGAHTATVHNVKAAVQRMRNRLLEDPSWTGLFVFSGHGATDATVTTTEGDLLRMCMEDFSTEDDPRGTSVGLGWLTSYLGDAADRVTIITDCCYSEFTIGDTHGAGALPPGDPGLHHYSSRLMLGSGEFSPAYGMKIGTKWRGVFSHALQTTLNLWRFREQDGVRYAMGSYQDVLFRTRMVLNAMGFEDQQPVYGGGTYVAGLPFNYPKDRAPRDAVSLEPNSKNRRAREVGSSEDIAYVWQFEVLANGVSVVPLALVQQVSDSGTTTMALQGSNSAVGDLISAETGPSSGQGMVYMAGATQTHADMVQLGQGFTPGEGTWTNQSDPSFTDTILISIPFAAPPDTPVPGYTFAGAYVAIAYEASQQDPAAYSITSVTWWAAFTAPDDGTVNEDPPGTFDAQVDLPQYNYAESAQWFLGEGESFAPDQLVAWYSTPQYSAPTD